MNFDQEVERERYTDLPDPPDGDPIWLGLLSDQQRETYALRIERGMGRNMSALYHIDRKRIARDEARAKPERQPGPARARFKLGDVARVRK